jgi:hypothetical protein
MVCTGYQVFLLIAAVLLHQALSFSVNPSLATHRRTSFLNAPLRPNLHPVSVSMTSSVHAFLEDEDQSGTVLMSATNDNQDPKPGSARSRLRRATGFSMTACRATLRAATGISLTAVYASTLAATSAYVRKAMALILSPLPAWFRYFLQPFLILYYAPLFILRNLAGPTGKQARETHELFVGGFKSAVDAAEEKADGYWPVHVTEEGDIVSVEPPTQQSAKQLDINEGIAKSVEAFMDDKDGKA